VSESKRAAEARRLREEMLRDRPPKGAGPEEQRVYGELYEEAARITAEVEDDEYELEVDDDCED
jgi:hypothetical protein